MALDILHRAEAGRAAAAEAEAKHGIDWEEKMDDKAYGESRWHYLTLALSFAKGRAHIIALAARASRSPIPRPKTTPPRRAS